MKHPHRYDLPKGHIEEGESEIACALRELREETGIEQDSIDLDPAFRYIATYCPRYKRYSGEPVEKTLVVFLGWLHGAADIRLSEHASYQWVDWRPPHRIQEQTIDPLLASAGAHFAK
jgi:8-oxo-dGTP pyrophosphatase MutT (NUDIX family)